MPCRRQHGANKWEQNPDGGVVRTASKQPKMTLSAVSALQSRTKPTHKVMIPQVMQSADSQLPGPNFCRAMLLGSSNTMYPT